MHDYTKLEVWRRSMELVEYTYGATRTFPPSERFGLTAQMRRAAVSVPANVAEGAARGTPAEFARFLRIAAGSVSELQTLATLASRVGLLKAATAEELTSDTTAIRQMLYQLEHHQSS